MKISVGARTPGSALKTNENAWFADADWNDHDRGVPATARGYGRDNTSSLPCLRLFGVGGLDGSRMIPSTGRGQQGSPPEYVQYCHESMCRSAASMSARIVGRPSVAPNSS